MAESIFRPIKVKIAQIILVAISCENIINPSNQEIPTQLVISENTTNGYANNNRSKLQFAQQPRFAA